MAKGHIERRKFMAVLGNAFALGIVLLICAVFFKNKYFLNRASKYYMICLFSTLAATVFWILRTEIPRFDHIHRVIVCMMTSFSQIFTIFTTTILAIYLITKVVEHIHTDKFRFGKIALPIIFALFCGLMFSNPFHALVFTITEDNKCIEGPLYYLSYITVALQVLVVAYYYIKYHDKLTKTTQTALAESIAAIGFCIFMRIMYPSVSFFVLAIALIELIFFLNFQNQRNGINSLTKLNEGRALFAEINKRIHCDEPFKIYVMKIRNFGSIRQNYSYTIGDEMLYQFSFHLSRLFSYGIPFHMYGTTFSLVLPYEESESEAQTQKLIEFLEKEIKFGEHAIKIDYILAEHVWADEGNVESIYEKLEYATEVAKENKQKYITCTLDLEAKRLRTKYLISRLEKIDLESGYQVWFQPIYSTGKKCFSSMEALLRLREPNGDFISPAEFIPLAEKTGRIKDITWFVLEESCRAMTSTPVLKDVRVSINLSMQQLLDPDFETKLNQLVDGYGIAHEMISFEFTERVIIEDLDAAEKNMNRLAATGYTFYLDDFGVGYSNFNCVLRLPLRTVKLDMSLTATAEKLRENYGLVQILTDLFHDMGMNVVAEGAEYADQVELLTSYGVDGIQGYYFARPMMLDKLTKFLKKENKKAETL